MARSPSTKRSLWLAGAVALIAVAAAAGLAPVRGSVAAAAARSATASVTGKRVSGADASASSSIGRFPSTFIAISTGFTGYRLAVYSASNCHLLKYLTAAEPDGGPGGPRLSADGVVIFQRGEAGISRVAQQVGGSAGIALLIMILQRASASAHTTAALASGFGDAFWWSAAFAAAALPLCLLLPGRLSPKPHDLGDIATGDPTEKPAGV